MQIFAVVREELEVLLETLDYDGPGGALVGRYVLTASRRPLNHAVSLALPISDGKNQEQKNRADRRSEEDVTSCCGPGHEASDSQKRQKIFQKKHSTTPLLESVRQSQHRLDP